MLQDVQDYDSSGCTGDESIKHFQLSLWSWQLYIPTAYETVMDDDYDVSGSSLMTIRERLMKLGGIQGIKVVDTLPANNVILVQMTIDVVRLVRGMGLTNVQWSTEGGMVHKFKVMTIQVPQIRSDQNGKTGIVHLAASF